MKTRTIQRLTSAAAVALVAAAGAAPTAGAEVPPPAHGRAWEPIGDLGADRSAPAMFAFGVLPAGNRLVYLRMGATHGAPTTVAMTSSLAERGATGWTETQLGYPFDSRRTPRPPFPEAASADLLTLTWHSQLPLTPGPEGHGWYRGTVGAPPTFLGPSGVITNGLGGVSDDGDRLVFATGEALVAEDAVRFGGSQVYEYRGTSGVPRLLGVDETGEPFQPCGQARLSTVGAPNQVSADGRRVFLTSAFCWEHQEVPERVFLNDDGEVTEISASQCTRPDCGPPATVAFAGATSDGAVAYLVTAAQLTDDDVDDSSDLYRYDVAAGTLARVAAGAAPVDAVATRVYPSDDGTRLYFLARGQLVPGKGTPGMPNVYVSDSDGIRFVATLADPDDWTTGWLAPSSFGQVELTPGAGDRMLLATQAALDPADTDSALDLYLYDATRDDAPVLVSRTAHGGNAEVPVNLTSGVPHTVYPFAGSAPRMLTADARRVVFRTAESLLPQDTDTAGDVYEWLDGEVGLISSGGGTYDVLLLGMSLDGASVFVSTAEPLVSADQDAGDYDLYVARLGGGFAELAPPPADPCDDGCPSPPPARAVRRTPPTLGHRGDEAPAALRLRAPTARDRARMAARGQLALTVRARAAGRVSALARARVGGRDRIVGRGRVRVVKAGAAATVRVALTRAARGRLAAGRNLTVRVVLRHSRLDGEMVRARLVLKGRT
jgi:hypothetical protein